MRDFQGLRRIAVITATMLLLVGCTNPDEAFKDAERSRSRQDYEKFLADFPESPLARNAEERIRDIIAWTELAQARASEPYQEYLDSRPQGLFIESAKQRLLEIAAYERVQASDTVANYTDYQDKYPDGMFVQIVSERSESLEEAHRDYELIRAEDDLDALRAFTEEYGRTGYGRLIQAHLEQVALEQTASQVLGRDAFRELPNEFDALVRYLEGSPPQKNSRSAWQAYEEILIGLVNLAGPGSRFVLPGLKVKANPGWDGYRYSVRASDKPADSILSWDYKRNSFSTKGSMSFMGTGTVVFTEYPSDRIPFHIGGYPLIIPATGSTITSLFGKPPVERESAPRSTNPLETNVDFRFVSHRTVWRIRDGVILDKGLSVKAENGEYLVFYLLEGIGPVYLYGTGAIMDADGNTLFVNDDRSKANGP